MFTVANHLTMRSIVLALLIAAFVFASLTHTEQSSGIASAASERILITSGGKLLLVERESKTILWTSEGLAGALSVGALPNGEFIVGEGRTIARINAQGKLIKRTESRYQMTTDVKPLANERLLVCDGPAGTVTESDWEGNTFWSVTKLHHPSEAVRLEDGNTLVADGTAGLKEFDSKGKLIRETRLRRWAAAVKRLPNGDTLVAGWAFVDLLTADSHVRWSLEFPNRVTSVQEISSGEYLIADPDAGHVLIVDAGGRVLWELKDLRSPWHAIALK